MSVVIFEPKFVLMRFEIKILGGKMGDCSWKAKSSPSEKSNKSRIIGAVKKREENFPAPLAPENTLNINIFALAPDQKTIDKKDDSRTLVQRRTCNMAAVLP